MKYFLLQKKYNHRTVTNGPNSYRSTNSTSYELYDMSGGVFFRLIRTIQSDSETKYESEALEYFEHIKPELQELCLSLCIYDQALDYSVYILPILRDKLLNKLGV